MRKRLRVEGRDVRGPCRLTGSEDPAREVGPFRDPLLSHRFLKAGEFRSGLGPEVDASEISLGLEYPEGACLPTVGFADRSQDRGRSFHKHGLTRERLEGLLVRDPTLLRLALEGDISIDR